MKLMLKQFDSMIDNNVEWTIWLMRIRLHQEYLGHVMFTKKKKQNIYENSVYAQLWVPWFTFHRGFQKRNNILENVFCKNINNSKIE